MQPGVVVATEADPSALENQLMLEIYAVIKICEKVFMGRAFFLNKVV